MSNRGRILTNVIYGTRNSKVHFMIIKMKTSVLIRLLMTTHILRSLRGHLVNVVTHEVNANNSREKTRTSNVLRTSKSEDTFVSVNFRIGTTIKGRRRRRRRSPRNRSNVGARAFIFRGTFSFNKPRDEQPRVFGRCTFVVIPRYTKYRLFSEYFYTTGIPTTLTTGAG